MAYSTLSQKRDLIASTVIFKFVVTLLLLFGGILLFTTDYEERYTTTSVVHAKHETPNTFEDTSLKRYSREAPEECSSNETVTSQGGTLISPGFPDRYPSNSYCRWLLTAPDDTSIVLRIKSLNLEKGRDCELDYVQIHLGVSSLSPSLDRLCGAIKDKVIVTNSSTVLVIFNSDPSYEDQGFSIDYFLQSAAGCPATLTTTSGTIASPNFPSNYPDNFDCWTLISADEEKQILLQFDSIDLEFDENCTYDFVQVYDGPSRDFPYFGPFCSTNQKVPVYSTTNKLLVYFHSDHLVNKKGFQAQYTTISSLNGVNFGDMGGCLWESESRNGSIASPNFPSKYPSNADCRLLLTAPDDERVTLVFDTLQMEVDTNCSYDYLEIRDGIHKEPAVIHKFCGKSGELKKLTSTYNTLLITFHSDDFAEFSGFKARYWFHRPFNGTELGAATQYDSLNSDLSLNDLDDIFIEKPQNSTLAVGSSYMLHCAVSDPVAKIRWLKDDQFLGGNTPLPGIKLVANNTLWIQSANKQVVGIYTCAAVTPEKTHYAKAWVKLENDPFPNDISCTIVLRKRPRNSSFTEGEFAHMECLAAGNQVQVHWEKDGLPLQTKSHITILRNGFLYMDKVLLQDAGTYTCITTDLISGCQKKASATLTVNEKAKLMEICGQPKVGKPSKTKPRLDHGKIVAGHDAKKGSHPWQVMLWEPRLKSFCGGTLINERWIITAAHCLITHKGLRWNDIIIKLGKHNREEKEAEEFETVIAEQSAIVIHPAYNKNNFDNDIALIRLRDHIKFTDYILPICLGKWELFENENDGSSVAKMGTVTGWGKLKENGASPKYLQEIQMPIVNQKTCINSSIFPVTRNMFCAGYAQEIFGDACSGDSGGPFVVYQENRWYLLGIVSWGEGCGRKNKYGFYTKITNYLPWIKGIMKS